MRSSRSVAATISLLFVIPCAAQSGAPNTESAAVKKGMTWQVDLPTNLTGTIDVGCNGPACDPHQGDTPCTEELPILCIRKQGTGFPLPKPASVSDTDQYHKWSGGVVGTTRATVPPKTRTAANALCSKEFGQNWRVAEFHDGWGWHFQAYGGVGDPKGRFWVDISDQPGALCWATEISSSSCTSNDQCPSGLLCCYPCGIPGCANACLRPAADGNCPLFP
jgi:hypothetical protein